MAIEPKRAALVGARDLTKVIETAIHAAGLQSSAAGALVVRWDLAGKVVRDFAEGQKFADAVAKQVTAGGIKATPAVLKIDKQIIAGFFERAAVPQLRNI